VIEFAQHLNIKEFYMAKDKDLPNNIWIPNGNDPDFANTSNAGYRIAHEMEDIGKFKLEEHPSGMLDKNKRYTASWVDV